VGGADGVDRLGFGHSWTKLPGGVAGIDLMYELLKEGIGTVGVLLPRGRRGGHQGGMLGWPKRSTQTS